MNKDYLFRRSRWLWLLALLTLVPIGSRAQSDSYEMVISQKGGSEVAVPITEGYPKLFDQPTFYGDETIDELFVEYEANTYYIVKAREVQRLFTRPTQLLPSIEPITKTLEIDFTNKFTGGENLFNQVVDNVYMSFDSQYGNGYTPTTKGLVLNTYFADWGNKLFDMRPLKVGDSRLSLQYQGLIVEVPAGSGEVKVDMETHGIYSLIIFNFANMGVSYKSEERSEVVYSYNVSEPTYIYIFPEGYMSAEKSSVVLYGLTVTTNATDGIQNVKKQTDTFTYDIYTTDGRLVSKAAQSLGNLSKGVYVIKQDNRRTFKYISR